MALGPGNRPRARAPKSLALDPDRLPGQLDRLYRAAWALCRSPHDADDLVQETLARTLARPRKLRGRDELPYLLRALRNTYLNQLRTQGRRPQTVELPTDEHHGLHSPAGDPEAAVERKELLASIAALPAPFREALAVVDLAGLPYREAARVLGIREATLTTRLFRARERVARTLGPRTAP